MRINVKKSIIIALDVILAAYVILAMTSFNNPDETARVCTKVSISIEDDNANGFLSVNEIKKILERRHLYPLNKTMSEVNPRDIEELLINKHRHMRNHSSSFVVFFRCCN